MGLLSGKTILVFKAINSTVQNTIISFPKEHQKVFSFKSCRVYKKRWQWSGLILSYATISESLIFQEMNWLANSFVELGIYNNGAGYMFMSVFMFTEQIL